MKILFTLLIILSTFNCLVKSQKFINFVPYQDYECTTNSYGFGYSISTSQECIYNLGNGPSNKPLSYSASWETFQNETYLYFKTYNYTDTACQSPLEQYSMQNNSCSPSVFLPTPFNGTIVGSEYQYSLISLTDEPVYSPNSLVFSQYQQPDFNVCSNGDLLFSTTVSNGLKTVNGEYSTSYICNNNNAYLYNCIDRVNCKLSNITLSCNQAGNINNQVNYC
ncbi:hypothetical protein DDB_G0278503 [Dictyostelium discoideum AX4]|uniref:Transmembrane protein n=1 Tax=Dictyostelium discoideum TaxID=44689 RepID=Q54XZ8_DICDI|nr:hypothetical protein DDB_G0278503 [Dictyostelium discoideum AX4]EAL68424.1 hypothetical protein DDB_G0278503 [Dictyostelium discoideum AX4]|eukprot:XP_642404.1 hypothetical protein DDB_G0278503 [Dictyostelium discoideum AX4]